ncbi:hypothetical protein CSC94_08940 [Zhengella mangrovi]|uniref:Uncharacterized protein n=1 Tax=Zhengella mangrovi TaxID=1982044 RepID=A0A2G1QQL5_9HYPH|nr:hypothetical protein CSC94_08940 [Zhengella mangrovi]
MKFLLRIPNLQFRETLNLCVHENDSRSSVEFCRELANHRASDEVRAHLAWTFGSQDEIISRYASKCRHHRTTCRMRT